MLLKHSLPWSQKPGRLYMKVTWWLVPRFQAEWREAACQRGTPSLTEETGVQLVLPCKDAWGIPFPSLKDKAGFGCSFLAKWLSHKPRGELLLLSQLKYDSAGSAELDGLAMLCLVLKAQPVPHHFRAQPNLRSPLSIPAITGCSHLHFYTKTRLKQGLVPGKMCGRENVFQEKKGEKKDRDVYGLP